MLPGCQAFGGYVLNVRLEQFPIEKSQNRTTIFNCSSGVNNYRTVIVNIFRDWSSVELVFVCLSVCTYVKTCAFVSLSQFLCAIVCIPYFVWFLILWLCICLLTALLTAYWWSTKGPTSSVPLPCSVSMCIVYTTI